MALAGSRVEITARSWIVLGGTPQLVEAGSIIDLPAGMTLPNYPERERQAIEVIYKLIDCLKAERAKVRELRHRLEVAERRLAFRMIRGGRTL